MRSAERTPGKLPRLAIGLAAALALVLGLCPAIALAGEVEVEGAGGPMVVTQDKGDGTEEPSVLVQGQGEEPALEAQAGDEHKHDGETFQPWESTTSMPTTGNYYLTEDVKLSERWDVMQTVRLCLNGHSVTYVGTDATVYMIFVWGNCTLDLYDETGAGVISGGGKTVHPCISLNGSSVFNMHGGTITGGGSEKSHDGGGVWVYNGSTFNMDGGTITGNRAYYGGGVFVEERGTFNMSGGTVTRNSAQTGGGVFLAGGHSSSEGESAPAATMSVSGDAAVCGNTDAGGTLASNVFLGAGGSVGEEGILTHDPALDAKVTVAGALSDGASIGVTMQEPGTFTTGFKDKMGAADPAKYFASDSDEYAVTTDAQGEGTLAKGYKVTVAGGIQNGTVSVDKAKAAAGDSLKVTTEAAEGYELDTVTDGGATCRWCRPHRRR